MDDHAPFIRTIHNNPDDDGPRLVYADWLEEQGECDRAELIRVQCELHAPVIIEESNMGPVPPAVFGPPSPERAESLRVKSAAIIERAIRRFRAQIRSRRPKRKDVTYWRGLITKLVCSWRWFCRHGHQLVWNPRMSRPCPPMVQMIDNVRLKTKPPIWFDSEYCKTEWPGVSFCGDLVE